MSLLPISAIVLTFNEERNLPKCLSSLASHVSEIVVVDSFSSDATVAIAKQAGARVVQHKYDGHPQQWQWVLDNVPTSGEWLFAIDADFVVCPSLWEDLARQIARGGADGYYVRHREVFRGRKISFGGMYPNHWLRIFKRAKVKVDPIERVDIHFFVEGRVGKIEHDVEEQNYKDDDIFFWIQKQNNFARQHAREELERRDRRIAPPTEPRLIGTPDQRKLWLKSIWYRMPLYVRPFIYFFYRYFVRLGFLDGKSGFVYHFTQGLLYRLLVDINIEQLLAQERRSESV